MTRLHLPVVVPLHLEQAAGVGLVAALDDHLSLLVRDTLHYWFTLFKTDMDISQYHPSVYFNLCYH